MEENIENPYKKICKYRFCRKNFTADDLREEYCCPLHKRRENNYKQHLERQKTKVQLQAQKHNERILAAFYEAGKYIVALDELLDLRFDFNANSSHLNDKINKRVTIRFFEHGITTSDGRRFQVVSFKNSAINLIKFSYHETYKRL